MGRIPDHELIAIAVRAGLAAASARTSGQSADQRAVAEPTSAAPATSTDEQIAAAMAVKARFEALAAEARAHFSPEQLQSWCAPPPPKEGTP